MYIHIYIYIMISIQLYVTVCSHNKKEYNLAPARRVFARDPWETHSGFDHCSAQG